MKKITLAIAAIIMGFVMASCGTKVAPTETILKATQEFFDQAKTKLSSIQSAEDFLAFVNNFNKERDDFSQNLFADYVDEEGNIKGLTEEELDELQSKLSDIATEYNKVEADKAAEFLTPCIDTYEKAVNALCEAASNADMEAFHNLTADFEAAEAALKPWGEYDNVLPELQQRAQAAEAKLNEVLTALTPVE